MVADKVNGNKKPRFTYENNVFIGPKAQCESDYISVGQLIYDRMKSNPNGIGQVDVITEVEDNFADMLDRSIKCAIWLKKQGIKEGDIVAVCTHNHLDSFVPCVAALFIGAIFTTWDYEMNIQSARHFMTLAEPKIIFANETSAGVLLETAKIEVLETVVVVFGDYPRTIPFSEVLSGHKKSEVSDFRCTKIENPRQTATILYSSGTTGLPKGVQLSHFALMNHLEVTEDWNLRGKVPLWFTTLYWISGVLLTLQALTQGTKKILSPSFDEELACKIIEKYKVTWVFFSTSMANRFVKAGHMVNYDFSSLNTLYIGGATLKTESQDALKKYLPHTTVLQAFGMTELGGLGANQFPDTSSGSCGVVSRNSELKIIDPETGKALGPNQTGELCAKTLTMMTGYYKNPEATKNTVDEEGWIHTGDLAYYNEKGEFFIIDRLKELIKYRGHHVSPCEIETLIQCHPAVVEVAVVGVPHPTDDEHPVAFVSKVPGEKVTEQELIDLVANTLMDRNKLRAGVKFMETLPHTPSGKIGRKELKAIAKTIPVS